MSYVIYMDKQTTQSNDGSTVFTVRSIGQAPKQVRAKSIWAAFEVACLTGDILVFESIATKEGK